MTPLPTRTFGAELARGLRDRPKRVAPKWFYDDAGSALFDRICELEEYYLTRTELAILRSAIASIARAVGPCARVIELGSGSGNKTRALLDALEDPVEYLAVDVSVPPLEASAASLRAAYPFLVVTPVCADFTAPLALPRPHERAARSVVYFPGSTIGNLAPNEASDLLRRIHGLGAGAMILGVDLKKDPARLHAAYNDREGVTAAFNKNLLARANKELGADFDLDAFHHYAPYSAAVGRVEMHLVSAREQSVRIGRESFRFEEGEPMLTECSYKYTRAEVERLAAAGGFRVSTWCTDERGDFAVTLLERG